jgi:hypothetical protein
MAREFPSSPPRWNDAKIKMKNIMFAGHDAGSHESR